MEPKKPVSDHCRSLVGRTSILVLAAILSACGDDDATSQRQADRQGEIRTLAYVVTECSEGPRRILASQKLQIRQADGRVVTVKEFPMVGPLPPLGFCELFAETRFGQGSIVVLPFQRLGVSPDGDLVIFEVTDDVSVLAAITDRDLVDPDEEGIFVVGADGTGLRRLGPASGSASFSFFSKLSIPGGATAVTEAVFSFRPDGSRVAFADLGPGPTAEEAAQIFTLDLTDGAREQVTHLPVLSAAEVGELAVNPPSFLDDDSIVFVTSTEQDGVLWNEVDTDGTGETVRRFPPAEVPGSVFVADLSLAADPTELFLLSLPGTPENEVEGLPLMSTLKEVFLRDGEEVVQITDFGRADTGIGRGRLLGRDEETVLFVSSADPLRSNPFNNCQFFSAGRRGEGLRQLTQFDTGEPSQAGCTFFPISGCGVTVVGHEPANDTVRFLSNCDPLGTNPNGGQIFSMRFDGTQLRQLTSLRSATTEADGTVVVELPGPVAYPTAWP
jgi:hypothetical protein